MNNNATRNILIMDSKYVQRINARMAYKGFRSCIAAPRSARRFRSDPYRRIKLNPSCLLIFNRGGAPGVG